MVNSKSAQLQCVTDCSHTGALLPRVMMQLQRRSILEPGNGYFTADCNTNELVDEHFRELLEEQENVSAWMCRVASMLKSDNLEGSQLM